MRYTEELLARDLVALGESLNAMSEDVGEIIKCMQSGELEK